MSHTHTTFCSTQCVPKTTTWIFSVNRCPIKIWSNRESHFFVISHLMEQQFRTSSSLNSHHQIDRGRSKRRLEAKHNWWTYIWIIILFSKSNSIVSKWWVSSKMKKWTWLNIINMAYIGYMINEGNFKVASFNFGYII